MSESQNPRIPHREAEIARLTRERDDAKEGHHAARKTTQRLSDDNRALRARLAELEAALRDLRGAARRYLAGESTPEALDEACAAALAPEPRCECGNPYEHGRCVYCKELEPRETPLTPCRAEHEFRPVDRATQDRLCRVCLQYESEILAGKPEPLPPLPHPSQPECPRCHGTRVAPSRLPGTKYDVLCDWCDGKGTVTP